LSIGIDFGIGIDQNSWYRTGIVSKPKKLVSPITTKLETSCKNEREPAKIAIYSVYYTKYPEQKWRRSIAKDVDFFNFRRRNTRKLQVLGSANFV
jgi:hypothetical protein